MPRSCALGQRVTFVEGEGPRLDALKDPAALQTYEHTIAAMGAMLAEAMRAPIVIVLHITAPVALAHRLG
jgi:hypothetical protein